MNSPSRSDLLSFFNAVCARAQAANVFGPCRVDPAAHRFGAVICDAPNSAEPASYRLFLDDNRFFAALVTDNRWLSQSIEQDLVHTGDKMEDLVEEELVELGLPHKIKKIEHFRSQPPEKLYTFRTIVPLASSAPSSHADVDLCVSYLRAIEAAFVRLGDMDASDED